MGHHFCHQAETLLVLTPREHQKTYCEVHALSVPHVWKVQSYFLENFLQSENVGLVSKVSRLGKGSRDIFTYLAKARVSFD